MYIMYCTVIRGVPGTRNMYSKFVKFVHVVAETCERIDSQTDPDRHLSRGSMLKYNYFKEF